METHLQKIININLFWLVHLHDLLFMSPCHDPRLGNDPKCSIGVRLQNLASVTTKLYSVFFVQFEAQAFTLNITTQPFHLAGLLPFQEICLSAYACYLLTLGNYKASTSALMSRMPHSGTDARSCCRPCLDVIRRHMDRPIRQSALLQDAMQSMNGVLDAEPDPQAAFNLVLCTFALGDKEMMKQAFSRLVEVVHAALHNSAICVNCIWRL